MKISTFKLSNHVDNHIELSNDNRFESPGNNFASHKKNRHSNPLTGERCFFHLKIIFIEFKKEKNYLFRQNSNGVFVLNLQSCRTFFLRKSFYMSVRLVLGEQYARVENSKVCSYSVNVEFEFIWPIWRPANRIEEELCSPRTLSLLNFHEHSKPNGKTYFKCQLSTVNV